jgi:hypothetical protein
MIGGSLSHRLENRLQFFGDGNLSILRKCLGSFQCSSRWDMVGMAACAILY